MNREIIGKLPDGSYGILISVDGVDVMTATPDKIAFDSRWLYSTTVHASGTLTGKTGDASSIVTFPPLPYIPLVLVNVDSPTWTSNPGLYCVDFIEYFTSGARTAFCSINRLEVTNSSLKMISPTLVMTGDISDYVRNFNYKVLRCPCK